MTIGVENTRFGHIEVEESKLIHINGGVLGFPHSVRYIILDHEENSPFKWLQSIDEPEVAFAITDPQFFFPDYHIQVKREELSSLEVGSEEDLVIFVILSLKAEPENMTANLQGPIVVNAKNRSGRQIVLKGSKYSTKHRLFPHLS